MNSQSLVPDFEERHHTQTDESRRPHHTTLMFAFVVGCFVAPLQQPLLDYLHMAVQIPVKNNVIG
jgi:hypothetical protein